MLHQVPSWTNWAGNASCAPARIARPRSVDEVCTGIAATDAAMRVAGAGHSFAPLVATDGLLLDLAEIAGVVRVDAAAGVATVRAGTRISALGAPLRAAGVGLANQGDVDVQAIAGAIATGTHGAGGFGSLATMVRGLRVVLPDGSVAHQDGAAAFALGMLGVIVEVDLAVVPAYRLHERTWHCAYADARAHWDEAAATARNHEFFWLPLHDRCVFKSFTATDAPVSAAVAGREAAPGTVERYLKPERVDWSDRIYPSLRDERFVEMEYAIPAESAWEVLDDVRSLMRDRHPELTWAVEFRQQAGDGLALSPTAGRDVVTISLHAAPADAWQPGFAAAERLCRAAGGRPHWGKLRAIGDEELASLYPRIDEVRAARRLVDPAGRFLNAYLRPLFG